MPQTSPKRPTDDARERFKAATKGRQSLVAEALGVSQASISRIASGDQRPTLEFAAIIEALYGIPCADWVPGLEALVAEARGHSFAGSIFEKAAR